MSVTERNPADTELRFRHVELGWQTAQILIKGGCWCFVAWCALQAIRALAGNMTIVDASLIANILLDTPRGLTITLSLSINAFFLYWGLKERKLRREKTEYLHARIKTLELMLDPTRSTSGLTPTGETNPEDR